jgi:transcriptional regulator with XRE-family HTH domain
MTTSYYADRMNLFHLMEQHPDWSQQELAQAVGRSKSWVQKWQKRFAGCSASDQAGLHHVAQGLSQARKTPPEHIDERIEALILELRDHPPEGLRRTPGPKTIL